MNPQKKSHLPRYRTGIKEMDNANSKLENGIEQICDGIW